MIEGAEPPAAHGLRVRDVVVAVDGHRVRNSTQYAIARALNSDVWVTLSAWRGGKTIAETFPRRAWVGFSRQVHHDPLAP